LVYTLSGPTHQLKLNINFLQDDTLKDRASNRPLIHHSDRGSQSCGDGYITLLKANGINISMTQSGDPRDNAIAERVNGILKQELLENKYRNTRNAKCSVDIAIDIYNRLRPHSSVDMMTPEKAHTQTGRSGAGGRACSKRKP